MRHTVNSILAAVAKSDTREQRRALGLDTRAHEVARWCADMFGEPTTLSPRLVFEYATGHPVEDFVKARDRTAELSEAASPDLCNAQRWVKQILDWACDHMQVNMGICFKCGDREVKGQYAGFPLCRRCMDDLAKARQKELVPEIERATKNAQDIVRAVFAQVPKSPKSHAKTCTQPRARHSYIIKTPAGYVQHDHSLCLDQVDAQRWTKAEKDAVLVIFRDIGTPVEVLRVVKS